MIYYTPANTDRAGSRRQGSAISATFDIGTFHFFRHRRRLRVVALAHVAGAVDCLWWWESDSALCRFSSRCFLFFSVFFCFFLEFLSAIHFIMFFIILKLVVNVHCIL